MAVQEADLLRSINAILESGERKREFDVAKALEYMKLAGSQKEAGQKAALQWMQIKQAKKLQDVQLAGESIDRLKKTNLQMMTVHANTFIDLSGLNRWYNPEDEGWREEMLKDLQDTDYYGFNEVDAYRIVGAVQSYYLKEPQFILEIASDLNAKMEAGVPDSFVKAFANPKGTNMFVGEKAQDTYQHLANVDKTLLNTELIMAEEFELGKSLDVEIDRDINMAELVQLPTGRAEDDHTIAVNAGVQGAFASEISGLQSEIKDDKIRAEQLRHKRDNLRIAISAAKAKDSAGLVLTPTELALVQDAPEAIGSVEDEIRELGNTITEKRAQTQSLNDISKEEAIRTGQIDFPRPISHLGFDPLKKLGLYIKSGGFWDEGQWVSDEVLEAAERAKMMKSKEFWEEMKYEYGHDVDPSRYDPEIWWEESID